MPRTTLDDRARKARIREREHRRAVKMLHELDNITDAQLEVLKRIKAAETSSKPVKTTAVKDWQTLQQMGVVREQDGVLTLTSIGAQVVAQP
jgi:archaeosine-15-forming tRNA-guanine transglycosylase